MSAVAIAIDAPAAPAEIAALCRAVGWDTSAAVIARKVHWATASGRDAAGALVAWCGLLSDGAEHAILLDVMVHPAWQGRGVGKALIRAAVAHCRARGIPIVHVDFLPGVQGFYAACGFAIGLGGILEFSPG